MSRAAVLAVVVVLALTLVVPLASAGPEVPRDKLPQCRDVLGEAKCDEIEREVRDLLTCTCPPW